MLVGGDGVHSVARGEERDLLLILLPERPELLRTFKARQRVSVFEHNL